MAISFDLEAASAAPAGQAFRTVADLRRWDAFGGVGLVGPDRGLRVGDRVEVNLRVMRRDIRSGCRVCAVVEPGPDTSGAVEIRAVDGPFESVVVGTVTPIDRGCVLRLELSAIGRGPARLLEPPVDYVLRQWAAHQLRHLLGVLADEPSNARV